MFAQQYKEIQNDEGCYTTYFHLLMKPKRKDSILFMKVINHLCKHYKAIKCPKFHRQKRRCSHCNKSNLPYSGVFSVMNENFQDVRFLYTISR